MTLFHALENAGIDVMKMNKAEIYALAAKLFAQINGLNEGMAQLLLQKPPGERARLLAKATKQ